MPAGSDSVYTAVQTWTNIAAAGAAPPPNITPLLVGHPGLAGLPTNNHRLYLLPGDTRVITLQAGPPSSLLHCPHPSLALPVSVC